MSTMRFLSSDVGNYKGGSFYYTLSLHKLLHDLRFMAFSDRLLGPGGSRDDAFEIAKGRLLLVQPKARVWHRT